MNKDIFRDLKVIFLARCGTTFQNASRAIADFKEKK